MKAGQDGNKNYENTDAYQNDLTLQLEGGIYKVTNYKLTARVDISSELINYGGYKLRLLYTIYYCCDNLR